MSECNEGWKGEAEAVIADIREHVSSAFISTFLPSSCKKIYINLTTFESNKYCIELTGRGFRVAGNEHDRIDIEDGEVFETPYAFLDSVSPKYRDSFRSALETKLNRIKDESSEDS